MSVSVCTAPSCARSHLSQGRLTWALLLVVVTAGGNGCRKPIDDVNDAMARKDAAALVELVRKPDVSLHEPALKALLSLDPSDIQVTLLKKLFESSGDEPLLRAAIDAWPKNPRVLEGAWETLLSPAVDASRAKTWLVAFVKRDGAKFDDFVSAEAKSIPSAFATDIGEGLRRVDALIDLVSTPDAKVQLTLASFELKRSQISAGSDTRSQKALFTITAAKAAQDALDKVRPGFECKTAETSLSVLDDLVSEPLPESAQQPLKSMIATVCPGMRPKVAGAVLSKVSAAAQSGAESGAPEFTRLAGGMSLLRAFSDSPDLAKLQARAEGLAKLAADVPTAADKVKVLSAEESELREERGKVIRIRGIIVAQVDTNEYEIALPAIMALNCYGSTCPSPRALLRTSESSFGSRGQFQLLVRATGKEMVRTNSGFTEMWDVYAERTSSDLREMESQLTETRKELARMRKLASTGPRLLENGRKALITALGQFDASAFGGEASTAAVTKVAE